MQQLPSQSLVSEREFLRESLTGEYPYFNFLCGKGRHAYRRKMEGTEKYRHFLKKIRGSPLNY